MAQDRVPLSAETGASPLPRPAVLITLLPIGFMLLLYLASPQFFSPMGDRPATWLGIPLTDVLTAIAVGWGLLGGLLVARSRRPYSLAVGFLAFTVPACVAIILAPAIILILQNPG